MPPPNISEHMRKNVNHRDDPGFSGWPVESQGSLKAEERGKSGTRGELGGLWFDKVVGSGGGGQGREPQRAGRLEAERAEVWTLSWRPKGSDEGALCFQPEETFQT